LLAGSKLGALLVVQGDQLTGIFTERDAVCLVLAKGLEGIGLSNAPFPSPWRPEHGPRRVRASLRRWRTTVEL